MGRVAREIIDGKMACAGYNRGSHSVDVKEGFYQKQNGYYSNLCRVCVANRGKVKRGVIEAIAVVEKPVISRTFDTIVTTTNWIEVGNELAAGY